MPLTGKYWIIPHPENTEVIDTSASEHALYAKKFLLGLGEGDEELGALRIFTKLSPEAVARHRERGVPGEILNFLRENADPRWYVIERFNWIRVARANFNVWVWDFKTAKLIMDAQDYWKTQDHVAFDILDVLELKTRKCFSISIRRLREIKNDQDAFKHVPEQATEE
jgi:hypothetical protein